MAIERIPEVQWLWNTPRETRAYAIRQYKFAYKTQLKLSQQTGKSFKMDYRKKKNTKSIVILARNYNRNVDNTRFSTYDYITTCTRGQKYRKYHQQQVWRILHTCFCTIWGAIHQRIISIGVRILATCYDPQGKIIEWVKMTLIDRIVHPFKKAENCQSKTDKKIGRR